MHARGILLRAAAAALLALAACGEDEEAGRPATQTAPAATGTFLAGERTLVVALDTGDERPAVDEVAELARSALRRLR